MRDTTDDGTSQRQQLEGRLCSAVRDLVATGTGKVVRMYGEAGIGKSTALGEIASEALEHGVGAWHTFCGELDASTPLAAIQATSSGDGRRLYRNRPSPIGLNTGLVPAPLSEINRFLAVDDIVEQTQAVCQSPTLFAVEDLHWADPATLHAISALARVTLDHPLLLVLTHRPVVRNLPFDRFVADLDDMGVEAVELQPLSPEEIENLVTTLAGGEPSAALRHRAHGAAGNPFLVRELIDGLLAEGRPVATTTNESSELPLRLQRAVGLELDRLGDTVRTLVRAASVAGNRVQLRDVAAALGLSPVTLSPDVENAINAGLFAEDGGHLVFRHDLLRDAVYQQMPSSVRRATHRELASALASRGAPPALVASHLLLADGNRAETLQRLQDAASDTAALAPETALEFLDRARDLAENDLELRRVLESARLEALTAAGRLGEAESIAHWLIEVSPPDLLGKLRARLAGLALIAGDGARAMEYVNQASVVAASEVDRSTYLALGAVVCATNNKFMRAGTMAEEAVQVGEQAGAVIGPSIALGLLGRMRTYGNDIESGLAFGSRSIALADADETGEAHAWMPCLHYGITAFDLDRLRVVDEMVARGSVLAQTHRMAWSIPIYGALAASCHLRRGDLDQARAEADASVSLAEQMPSRQALAWAQSILGLVAVEADEPDEARRWADASAETWASGVTSFGAEFVTLAQVRTLQIESDTRAAFVRLCDAWSRFADRGMTFCHPVLATDLAMLAMELGESAWLDTSIAAVERAAASNRVTAVVAQAKWLRALRDHDRASARAAHGLLMTTDRRLEAASWLVAAPELLGDESHIDETLGRALVVFDEAGAVRSANAVRARLATGDQLEPQATSRWDQLTPTELDIVRLLAQGSTNAEIAGRRGSSRRTIESHLGRVYRKLGIDGRVRLTVAAATHFGPTAD